MDQNVVVVRVVVDDAEAQSVPVDLFPFRKEPFDQTAGDHPVVIRPGREPRRCASPKGKSDAPPDVRNRRVRHPSAPARGPVKPAVCVRAA